MRFDEHAAAFVGRGLVLGCIIPLIDGTAAAVETTETTPHGIAWRLDRGTATLTILQDAAGLRLDVRLDDIDPARKIDSLGLRFGVVQGVRSYLRNGYQSWDGSFFVAPGTPTGDGPPGKAPTIGFAMTALLPDGAEGAAVLGFTRHDRFQSRLRFGGTADAFTFDIETMWDRVAQDGALSTEAIVLIEGDAVEETLRDWSRIVAAESPLSPRLPPQRITGWCSWYGLYAAIDEPVIREHLAAARTFRDRHAVDLGVFQIDDGFTPEMGDWLDVKPQFPHGMAPLVAEIADAGFIPGLWIAPFMVGNRSKLATAHPEWLVKDAATGDPLVQMRFYGEFRWHKRSEEYLILDITHPDAEAYIRQVFRIWAREWGVRYFKADFLLFGSEHGPDVARWHRPGLSRVHIWRLMLAAMREEIGDALLLGCGCPLWASVGLVDAIRIGRDIGVEWSGEYSAESLLRDQVTRNHAANILWQADPDCVLLRENFHYLTDAQVETLAKFAGLSGGVLMTSDKLDTLRPERAALFVDLLRASIVRCDFPRLGTQGSIIEQIVQFCDGSTAVNAVSAD